MPSETAFGIPPEAGPGSRRGWHDLVYRVLDLGLGRTSPRARAWLSWRLDPVIYRVVGTYRATIAATDAAGNRARARARAVSFSVVR